MVKKVWLVTLTLLLATAWREVSPSRPFQLEAITIHAAEMNSKRDYDTTGTVIGVDQEDRVSLRTHKGTLTIPLPGASKVIKEGDQITLHLGCKEGEVSKFKAFPYLARPTVEDYLRCVKGCRDILLGRGLSLDRCIEGCRGTTSP